MKSYIRPFLLAVLLFGIKIVELSRDWKRSVCSVEYFFFTIDANSINNSVEPNSTGAFNAIYTINHPANIVWPAKFMFWLKCYPGDKLDITAPELRKQNHIYPSCREKKSGLSRISEPGFVPNEYLSLFEVDSGGRPSVLLTTLYPNVSYAALGNTKELPSHLALRSIKRWIIYFGLREVLWKWK